MAVEEISARLRARLQQEYGVDEANILMDRPPGGWSQLVTKEILDQTLDHRFELFEHKLMSAMDREFRAQTWRIVTAMFAAVGTFAAAIGATAALLRL
jgi:hypothetical protein